jgi:hypothetical protein
MNNKSSDIREKILKGLDLTFQKLIKNKKDRNLDIVISKDGKVVRINPNDLIL